MTAPIKISSMPPELLHVWLDEAPGEFVPTIKILAVSVRQACNEIGRQFRIAKAQQ